MARLVHRHSACNACYRPVNKNVKPSNKKEFGQWKRDH